MTRGVPLPEPVLHPESEREIWRMLQKGFEPNKWRPDFEEWSQKRLWAERHQDRVIATLEKWAGPLLGKRVLDLGSGRGGLSVALSAMGVRVTSVDLRRRNLRILGLRAARYGFTARRARAVGEALPFAGASFDLVVCKDVTEHCRSPRVLLSEVSRLLAPGGAAYVTFINRLAWIDPHYRLAGVNFLPRPLAEFVIGWRGRGKASIRDCQRLSDMHYFSVSGARNLARSAGLSYTDITAARMEQMPASRARVLAHRLLSVGASTLEARLALRKDRPPE